MCCPINRFQAAEANIRFLTGSHPLAARGDDVRVETHAIGATRDRGVGPIDLLAVTSQITATAGRSIVIAGMARRPTG